MATGIVTNWSKRAPRFPWVTLTFILVCLGAWLFQAAMTPLIQQAMLQLGGVVPVELHLALGQDGGWNNKLLLTLLTALFIHTGWWHLVGNLVYVWVFGLSVERRLGGAGMLVVFMLGGALANLIVAFRAPDLASPIVGASGAVSSVIGAYLGLFPFKRIGVLLPLGLFLQFARIPAVFVIGSWFTLQLVYSLLGPITGVVAWWTHMTGFTLGLIFALMARAIAQVKVG